MCGRLSDRDILDEYESGGVRAVLDSDAIYDTELPATPLGEQIRAARKAVRETAALLIKPLDDELRRLREAEYPSEDAQDPDDIEF